MGWDHLFAGILASLIVDKHDQRKKEKVQLQKQQSNGGSCVASISERLFISARDKRLTVPYKKVSLDCEDDANSNFGIIALSDSDQDKLRYYYSRLETVPSSFDCRTELIHFILRLWKDKCNENMIDLLQNELVYLIDYMSPCSQEEHMYQHLAMFLSAECYFFKGEFANALKRLYQVLDWQEIYDNVDGKDGIDFNGLYYFHEAVVSNIINLYALAGLPEKADEVREACRALVKETHDSYYSLIVANGNDANMRNFLQSKHDMIMATNSLQGYYLFSDIYYTNNLFKESVTTFIRGQAIYSIETLPYDSKSFTVIEDRGMIDGELVDYMSLCIQCYGTINNYEAALNRDREEMRRI